LSLAIEGRLQLRVDLAKAAGFRCSIAQTSKCSYAELARFTSAARRSWWSFDKRWVSCENILVRWRHLRDSRTLWLTDRSYKAAQGLLPVFRWVFQRISLGEAIVLVVARSFEGTRGAELG